LRPAHSAAGISAGFSCFFRQLWEGESLRPVSHADFRFRSDAESYEFDVTADENTHHYVLVADDENTVTLYVDGIENASEHDDTSAFTINTIARSYASAYRLHGLLDEVRISSAKRSANWAWASWSNQVSGSTFCDYGAVEDAGEQTTSNGTSYAWLANHGITNNQETADVSDPDGDGALTWEEYQAGTDPTDASSVFCVLNIHSLISSNCIVWYGTTNSGVATDFVIYRATNLLSPSWQAITTTPRSITGTNIWWDEHPLPGVPLFYRPALP